MRWWPAASNIFINNCWMASNYKEGSRQAQTTTNYCALKAGKQRPSERASGNIKGKDNAGNKEKHRG
jgi:hypothetical protein